MAGSNLSPEVSRGPMLCDCFVVEDDQSTRDVVLHALDKLGLVNRAFAEAPAVVEALDFVVPKVVFLDVFLGGSDAIEVIRALAERAFRGVVQLVSGQRPSLVADVRKVGERYGLRMRAPIQKPFPLDAIRLVITEEGVLRETSTVKGDLGEALRNGWVEFFYQPKINLRTRVIIGAEALARIRHPEDGILAASSFIPGAKQVELRELSLLGVATALRD